MAEPTLPILPDSVTALKPKSSGTCLPNAILLMFLVAMPINLIWGVIAHYIGIVVSYLGLLVWLLFTYVEDRLCWMSG